MATGTAQSYRYAKLHIRAFDVRVPAVIVGRTYYFPARQLAERMGLSLRSQRRRLQEDPRIAKHVRFLPVPTVKGQRDTLCIRKEGVSVWFTLIEPGKCALAETRERLERFQAELFAAADRFLFGDTSDVVYDEATKASEPIIGLLRVGHCPRCGLALRLAYTDRGAHLEPDPDE